MNLLNTILNNIINMIMNNNYKLNPRDYSCVQVIVKKQNIYYFILNLYLFILNLFTWNLKVINKQCFKYKYLIHILDLNFEFIWNLYLFNFCDK